MILKSKTEVKEKESFPTPLCPPQNCMDWRGTEICPLP